MMTALQEDEQAQIHGIVSIGYYLGTDEVTSQLTNLMARGGPLLMAIPFRPTAFHFCCDKVALKPWASFIMMVMGKDIRMRFRTHIGKSERHACPS